MYLSTIPMEKFGKDHWSTLLYLETCIVDHKGKIDDERKMRTTDDYDRGFPTRLNDGTTVEDHDDWDCLSDLCVAGILTWDQGGDLFKFGLTDYGWQVAGALRRWVAEDNPSGQFVPFARAGVEPVAVQDSLSE